MALALITDFSRYLKPPPLGGESIHLYLFSNTQEYLLLETPRLIQPIIDNGIDNENMDNHEHNRYVGKCQQSVLCQAKMRSD